MAGLEAALEALKSLKIGEDFEYTEIAKRYGCNRSTLSKRHRGVQQSNQARIENMKLLSTVQEEHLLKYIHKLCDRGLPPSRSMIRNFAAQIAQKSVGLNWADRFVKNHNVELISHYATALDRQRFKADSPFKYNLYFELLKQKIVDYNIDSRYIYNMDEKGFLIRVLLKVKRIFSREAWEAGRLKNIIQDGNREWITTIACICADGTSLSPALIYQAISGNIQDTWLQDFSLAEHETFFTSTPSGWTNNDVGLAWLKQVFDRETKAKARSSWRLLILDGHGSHVTMDFIEYCDNNKILLMILPPHSTHTLQPLDVGMFAPLAGAYQGELISFIEKSQGLTSVTKRDFFRLFYQAWIKAFKLPTILSAFAATGISPLNPTVILSRFSDVPKQLLRPSLSGSASSRFSASDWQRVERLLQKYSGDNDPQLVEKLRAALHQMSVENTLLKIENKHLRAALGNEKKRRKRGKALLLEPPEDYHGGAVFWSPTKIQQARDRQMQKDLDEVELQHQKSEAIKQREQQKIAKAELMEERRLQRFEAKQLREQKAAEKAAAREENKLARQLKRQLQNDTKQSQIGKRYNLKSLEATEVVVVEQSSEMVEKVVLATSRSGRPIRPTPKAMT